MGYDNYRKEQIDLQIAWRKNQKDISKEYGFQNGNEYPHIIPKNEWFKTVYKQFEANLLEYLDKEDIQHHTGSHNLLSSWILCANLYFGIFINENLKELFRQFLEKKLSVVIDKIEEMHLEYVLGGNLNPKELLGEPGGKRGTKQTTPDLAIVFTSKGKKGLLLVECKYTEKSFYNCSGGKVNSDQMNSCKNKEALKNLKSKCFMNEWNRKYWNYLKISDNGLKLLNSCPAFIGGFQIVRQQALAEGIATLGKFNYVWSCIAYDGRNENLMKSMKPLGINSIKRKWENLFELKTNFSVWEHQEWVKYVNENGKGLFERNWLDYINDRYNMRENVSSLFFPEPEQYGLRGDFDLWDEMCLESGNVKFPKNENVLKDYFYKLFRKLTGFEITTDNDIYIKRFSHGSGMSDGQVAQNWWLEKGIPLLIERYKNGIHNN
jgi:hypothetical protein